MASGPVIGVLALQGDVREHAAALTSVGARPVEVKRPEEFAGLDGLVLPGGESTTLSRLMRVFGMRDPLRDRVRDGLPVYGSCAGMILLADEVLDTRADHEGVGGLDVVVRRNAFGRQVDSFEAELTFASVGAEPLHAVFIRAPWVEKAGADVEVLATVAPGSVVEDDQAVDRIVAVRQGPLLATAFHPELTGDARVHGYFVEIVRGQA